MAKITKHGGPSDKLVEIDGPMQHPLSRRPQIGVVKSSATGISLRASSESETRSDNDERPSLQPPAPTTDSHSKPEETPGPSTVDSMDGNGPETPKAQSAKKVAAPKKGKGRTPQTRVVDEDDDEFDEPIDLSGSDSDDEFK